jgi:hypothetical protein
MKIDILENMKSIIDDNNKAYFSLDYLKKILKMNKNDIRMSRIKRIFNG